MKLSIVITTRNRRADLLRCVDSIRRSNFDYDFELIVVDDKSNDGTEKLIPSDFNLPNTRIIHNNNQQMMVRSRNIGIKESKGKYILFVDDDNILDIDMVRSLTGFADKSDNYGIVGPSMYYLDTEEKYLDFQKINMLTGKTSGRVDNIEREFCDSDGIPNVFLVKSEVFDECGYFDEDLIQTFTEPDFAFSARKHGYGCVILKSAKTFHNVSRSDSFKSRSLGGQFSQKAYCLMRNRTIIVSRYGKWYEKIIYLLFFSWLWPLIYSSLVLGEGRFDLIKLYWRGFFDGVKYFFTGKVARNCILNNI